MLQFGDLTYQNFQSVGASPITIDLSRNRTTLVGGPNGAGKSTIVEALSYVLYGKSLKKLKLTGLINSINKKKMQVSVKFKKNGHDYQVIRGEKPKLFEIWCDGTKYNETAAARDNQAQLEYILGFDFKMFTQVIVLNRERYVPFMDLDAAARRRVVEDVLDIGAFSVASVIVREKLKTVVDNISTLKYKHQLAVGELDNITKLINESKSNSDLLIKQQRDIISDAMKRVDEISVIVDRDKPQVEAEYTNLDRAINSTQATERELSQIATQFTNKIRQLKSDITSHQKTSCPTCGQNLPREKAEEHIAALNADLSQYESSLVECQQKLSECQLTKTVLMQEMQSVAKRQQVLSNMCQEQSGLIRQCAAAEKMILQLQQQTKADEYQARYDEKSAEVDAIKTQLNLEFVEESELKIMRDLLKDDGIKSHIIAEYLDFLNNRINKYLYGMDFYLNITLDSEFNDTVHNSQYEGFSYENLSTGQKCRVNIAIWLALLEIAAIKNSIATNLLFIDEILENLDQDGVQLVMKLIKSKLSDKNVFVITQRFDEFRDSFESDIRFKLVDDFTAFA